MNYLYLILIATLIFFIYLLRIKFLLGRWESFLTETELCYEDMMIAGDVVTEEDCIEIRRQYFTVLKLYNNTLKTLSGKLLSNIYSFKIKAPIEIKPINC